MRRLVLPATVILAGMVVAAAHQALPFFGALDTTEPIPYVIGDGSNVDGFRPGDRALAEWAMAAWETAADGAFTLAPSDPPEALVRVQWISPAGGLYGEMRPVVVGGRRGAIVFVMPDVRALGPLVAERAERDPLFRDTIVYLTCLHELGHAFGLEHTADYDDIMYFFGHGGDIVAYFERYRDLLTTRDDIRRHSGLSNDDRQALRALYPTAAGPQTE